MPEQRFSVSFSSVLVVLITTALLVLLWQIRFLVVITLTAVVVAASMAPIVDVLEGLRLPRWLATLMAYMGLIATVVGLIFIIGPAVLQQIQQLIRQLPTFVDVLGPGWNTGPCAWAIRHRSSFANFLTSNP